MLNAAWPPHISLFPHDHRMWAAIGVYGGQEENTYYNRVRTVFDEAQSSSEGSAPAI
jgi:predicted metal-dependent enzyme (double-stranded beta helix superfamily)